jgi:hypothetical protein
MKIKIISWFVRSPESRVQLGLIRRTRHDCLSTEWAAAPEWFKMQMGVSQSALKNRMYSNKGRCELVSDCMGMVNSYRAVCASVTKGSWSGLQGCTVGGRPLHRISNVSDISNVPGSLTQ